MLTSQEIFDRVALHLSQQGVKAESLKENSTGEMTCLYRTAEGKKCAVGCLIPDELYDKTMEGRGVVELFERFPDVIDEIGLSSNDQGLLYDLQKIHDYSFPSSWKENLKRLAINRNLCYNE